jgi:hypothetical protein
MTVSKLNTTRALAKTPDVADLIKAGRILLVAGDEAELTQLPEGKWVGGTVSGFLTPDGFTLPAGQLIYADLSQIALRVELRLFDSIQIQSLSEYYPCNGFALAILPGYSAFLENIATHMSDWQGLYNIPLAGWVSAVPLAEIGHRQPKVFCGTGTAWDDHAAIMYVTLPDATYAELNVVNPFCSAIGPAIRFSESGYRLSAPCMADGQSVRLIDLITNGTVDASLPLIADRDGALVNNSIINIESATGDITFLSPIETELVYHFAEASSIFKEALRRAVAGINLPEAALASVCVACLPHFSADIRPMLPAIAPVTFGQIGYTVLTQTITSLNLSCLPLPNEAQDPS